MKTIINGLLILVVIGFSSCKEDKTQNRVTNIKDYQNFFSTSNTTEISNVNTKITFWNKKIKEDSLQILALQSVGRAYEDLFNLTGDIKSLKKAEKALYQSARIAAVDKESFLLTLAQNYITQHQFRKADSVAKLAYEVNPGRVSKMVLFDVAMELGNYEEAKKYLEDITNVNDYNFLIRLAKWEDYQGNLDSTIRNMEKAQRIAESSRNKNLMLWVYTNLADYYGHAGRIEDSYNYYLKSLELDPSNTYAMKGIAWIVYSYEKKPTEALRIIEGIEKKKSSPDYYLLKAEIAEFLGKDDEKRKFLRAFMAKAKDPNYGVMYNSHLATVLAEDYRSYEKALEYADMELQNRPTPMSYDLKAHILNLKGNNSEALKLASAYVVDKTSEPTALLHLATIYKTNNLKDDLDTVLPELKASSYELGPVVSKKVNKL